MLKFTHTTNSTASRLKLKMRRLIGLLITSFLFLQLAVLLNIYDLRTLDFLKDNDRLLNSPRKLLPTNDSTDETMFSEIKNAGLLGKSFWGQFFIFPRPL